MPIAGALLPRRTCRIWDTLQFPSHIATASYTQDYTACVLLLIPVFLAAIARVYLLLGPDKLVQTCHFDIKQCAVSDLL